MNEDFGAHSRRTTVDENAPRLFDVEPYKTAWSKDEIDKRLQSHWDRAAQQFHDRRTD